MRRIPQRGCRNRIHRDGEIDGGCQRLCMEWKWLTVTIEFQFCMRRKSGGQLPNNTKVADITKRCF